MALNQRVIIVPISFELICPRCQETIPSPIQGSLFWTDAELSLVRGRPIACPGCHQTSAVPVRR